MLVKCLKIKFRVQHMIKKYEIFQEEFLVHYLRRAARHSLEAGRAADEQNAKLHFLSSIMSSAFALEAFFNYVGSETVPGYEFMEKSLQPMEKLGFLSAQNNIPHDPSQRPVQTIKTIFGFRNFMAHGKAIRGTAHQETEVADDAAWRTFSETARLESDKIIDEDDKKMVRDWERYRALWTADFAERCLTDAEAIMTAFADATGLLADAREQGATNPIWERLNRRVLREINE
jgi:hypothetical protein